jgi:hypothetical protein
LFAFIVKIIVALVLSAAATQSRYESRAWSGAPRRGTPHSRSPSDANESSRQSPKLRGSGGMVPAGLRYD